MPNLTGDSSGINLADPINLSIPADGQPASVGSALGIQAVLQRVTNFIKALVVRGDNHNGRLLTLEGLNLNTRVSSTESQIAAIRVKTDPAGSNALWHAGNLKLTTFSTSVPNGISVSNGYDHDFAAPGVQIGDICVPNMLLDVPIVTVKNRLYFRAFVLSAGIIRLELSAPFDSLSIQLDGTEVFKIAVIRV